MLGTPDIEEWGKESRELPGKLSPFHMSHQLRGGVGMNQVEDGGAGPKISKMMHSSR